MLLVTSLQVFLLLLSAPRQLFAFRYYDLEDVGFYGARGTDAECDAHLVIKSWINEQIVTNAKLTSLNLNLGKVLDVINNTNPNQAGEEHCCFYENKTMSTIFKGLGKLTTTSDTPNTNPLEATGDLGKDLDIILDQLKAISSKKMKTCCEKLAENLKTVEADLMKELEEVRRKLKKQHGEVNDQADKLKKKQTDLENQLKSVTNRIEELEKQQKVNKEEAAKCCKELNDKVNELNKQLEQAKAEASKKAKQLEKDINDLNQKQQEHANKLDILQKETEKHGTIIAQTTQVCIDNCGNGTGNGPNKIKELEQMIVNLVEKFNQLSNLSIATANCSKIMEELIEIQNTLNQLGNQTSGNNNCPSLAELQAEIEKAKQCCNRIDALSQKLDDMMKQIEELKNNYTKHVTQLETSLSQVQEKIDNAFAQLQNISTAIQTCTNGNGTDESEAQAKRLADLQNQVNSLKTILNMTQTNLNINEAKLVQLDKTLDEKWKEFQKLNADRLKNLTEFKDQTEKRLYELQLLLSNSSSAPDQNLTERVIKLEKLHEKMLVDIQRILELQTMILNLENQLKEALQKLKDHDAKWPIKYTKAYYTKAYYNKAYYNKAYYTKAHSTQHAYQHNW
ncbi:rho-associated protein kinase 2 [Drosophila navojoa]|uniref:rho-associated protein kinase 2 n=1 Tax=Drosophila navojoa TaxID=7232 RepID=UPI000847BDBA|nr:rho-associated protein kinase 2 [Drosophila navojoa]